MNRHIRVEHPHDDLADDTYHEWVHLGETSYRDALGRPNNGSGYEWQVFICNNGQCHGVALVRVDWISYRIDHEARP